MFYIQQMFYHLYISLSCKQNKSGLHIARIACEYNVKSCDIQQCNILTQMNTIYMTKWKDLGDNLWKINFVNELIDVVHQTAESRLTPEEVKDILLFLASDWSSFFNRN